MALKTISPDCRVQASLMLYLLFFQSYHSQFLNPPQLVGNMALLPLRTQFKGPAPRDSKHEFFILVSQFPANSSSACVELQVIYVYNSDNSETESYI